jgi:tRNA threonylcarbamoyladenosine biosynthesis protein TsaB
VILALDTATTACSAALCAADGAVVAERLELEGPAHSQVLLPAVHAVLAEAGAGWADLDVVAVGPGPRAVTRLRIGIATARALVQADAGEHEVRLAGVPTLAALALALAHAPEWEPGLRLVPVVDGRRREVFTAVYERDGAVVRAVSPAQVVAGAELHAWLGPLGPVLLGGDGVEPYAAQSPVTARRAASVPAPTAAQVGLCVAREVPGLVWGPDRVLPLYGRSPDAAPWSGAPAAGGAA